MGVERGGSKIGRWVKIKFEEERGNGVKKREGNGKESQKTQAYIYVESWGCVDACIIFRVTP